MQTENDIELTPGLSRTADGRLMYDGCDCVTLAKQFGTPLYLMNESAIRQNCRRHLSALRRRMGATSVAAYACKALSCRQLYRIMAEEGMYADAVSAGELYTAHSADFDMSHIIFHGNCKTPADIDYAISLGVGLIVADSAPEPELISRAAEARGRRQDILLRLTPGIDPHTHKKISTGQIDSKFGLPPSGVRDAVELALSLPGVRLRGVHYHIGSQIAAPEPFCDALEHILATLNELRCRHGFTAELLNLGGGFGVRYIDSDPAADLDTIFSALGSRLDAFCRDTDYPRPAVITEPGRSIVADAGITLYTVGAVKRSDAGTLYVAVDGGMTDNPRYTLYGAEYTALAVTSHGDESELINCSIVGRCCESGDILIPHARLPRVIPGDIIAVLNTGAYNYSMASNYNRIPRPPIVMLRDGEPYIAVRRERVEDVAALDI